MGFPRPLSCNDIGLHECTFKDSDVIPLNAMHLAHTKSEKSILPFFPSTEVFPEDFFDLSQTDINCASLSRNVSAVYQTSRPRARARVLHTLALVGSTDGVWTKLTLGVR